MSSTLFFSSLHLSSSICVRATSNSLVSLFISSYIRVWQSTSAASNSCLLAANLEGIAHPLKRMFTATFIPFLLCVFLPSLPLSRCPGWTTSPSLLASIKTKLKLGFFKGTTPHIQRRGKQGGETKIVENTNTYGVLLGAVLLATMIPLCCNRLKWDLEVFFFPFHSDP